MATTNIEMNRPNITLATEGTYCENDIKVSAKLQEKTATTNGDVTPDMGYCGIGKVTVSVPQAVPIEISTASEMTALLVAANVGKVYKFTGTTDDTYTNGNLYEVVNG